MSRIFLDTNLFVYLLEDSGILGKRVTELLDSFSARNDEVVTSMLTLAELMVKPLADGDLPLAQRYERLLTSPGIDLVPFDRSAAWVFAALRKDKTLKAADAIQLACAASAKCDLFITNDQRLSRMVVPGIQFISSLDRAPL